VTKQAAHSTRRRVPPSLLPLEGPQQVQSAECDTRPAVPVLLRPQAPGLQDTGTGVAL